MEPLVSAAIIAGVVSVFGVVLNVFLLRRNVDQQILARRHEFESSTDEERRKWKMDYADTLKRDLVRERTLHLMRDRREPYEAIWHLLERTSNYHIRNSPDLKADIQAMVIELSAHAYGKAGMLMSDRSRNYLLALRRTCGKYLRSEMEIKEVRFWAHSLKHSMRGDLGIDDEAVVNYIDEVDAKIRHEHKERTDDEFVESYLRSRGGE